MTEKSKIYRLEMEMSKRTHDVLDAIALESGKDFSSILSDAISLYALAYHFQNKGGGMYLKDPNRVGEPRKVNLEKLDEFGFRL